MNTTERIVESYYRLCKNCFTIPDVKVIKGNNRQIDLLAYNMKKKAQYHVEVSVTHSLNWCPTIDNLKSNFDKKFFGIPPKREGKNTDYAKGKTYKENIDKTYMEYGFSPNLINRIWVCWTVKDINNLDTMISKYCRKMNLNVSKLNIVSFRDEIIPALNDKVSTTNYEDDSLRMLSLLKQYQKQSE